MAIIIFWIFYTVLLLVLYHKFFVSFYGNLLNGLLGELVMAIIFGCILALLSVYFWIIGVIVIMAVALFGCSKVENPKVKKWIIIIGIVVSIIVAITGHQIRKNASSKSENEKDNYAYDNSDYSDDDSYLQSDYNGGMEENNDNLQYDVNGNVTEIDSEEEEDSEENISLEFILPNSDSVYITKNDLDGMSADECRIARNEIYARHGRMFNDQQLQEYFNNCSWYVGTIAPESFSGEILNDVEIANLQTISEYEADMGY